VKPGITVAHLRNARALLQKLAPGGKHVVMLTPAQSRTLRRLVMLYDLGPDDTWLHRETTQDTRLPGYW
jgi:hypothetical protein